MAISTQDEFRPDGAWEEVVLMAAVTKSPVELAAAIRLACGDPSGMDRVHWVGTDDVADTPPSLGLEGHFTAAQLRAIADLLDAHRPA